MVKVRDRERVSGSERECVSVKSTGMGRDKKQKGEKVGSG